MVGRVVAVSELPWRGWRSGACGSGAVVAVEVEEDCDDMARERKRGGTSSSSGGRERRVEA